MILAGQRFCFFGFQPLKFNQHRVKHLPPLLDSFLGKITALRFLCGFGHIDKRFRFRHAGIDIHFHRLMSVSIDLPQQLFGLSIKCSPGDGSRLSMRQLFSGITLRTQPGRPLQRRK